MQIIGSDRTLDKRSSSQQASSPPAAGPSSSLQVPSWQTQLKEAIRTPAKLCAYLGLESGRWQPGAEDGHALFPIRVPLAYARRMVHGDPHDPLLRQVLPVAQETDTVRGYSIDPLQEAAHTPRPGLIHKYRNRVLLIASGGCAINCRYCFRRHFPYQDNRPSRTHWADTLDYVLAHPEINEVILSGGDPLLMADHRLAELIAQIEKLPHVTRLRIHTRLPVVIPDRITDALCHRLSASRLQKVMVLHINHPAEIDEAVSAAAARLHAAKVTVLNQSVLLRGVNDDVAVLASLSERLFAAGILPYYLHTLDPVAGAAHFDVPDRDATALMDALRAQLAGFLMPRLVREIPGQVSKTPLY